MRTGNAVVKIGVGMVAMLIAVSSLQGAAF